MADIYHYHGSDLVLSPTGDIAVAVDSDATQQRVLRRLLTAPGAYIWQPKYGAGLPAMVGKPARQDAIAAITRAQMRLEATVAQSPAPGVSVAVRDDGTVTETITYTDATSGQPQVLTLPLGA